MSVSETDFKKVLVVSHNSFSDRQNNGKTLSAFFSGWDKEKLAQIYLTTDVPDFTVCERFFQLTDFDMLRRLFDFKSDGRLVSRIAIDAIRCEKDKVRSNWFVGVLRKNAGPFFRFSRDLLWRMAGFKTGGVKKFIEEFKPDVVFFQSSSGVFAFLLVRWICCRYKLPLVMQTTDDYLSARVTFNPFFWFQYFGLVGIYKWASNYADSIIAISDDMKWEYAKRFGGEYYVAMNAFDSAQMDSKDNRSGIVNFLYAGNLGLNRWRVLAEVGQCLAEVYEECGVRGVLSIYSLSDPGPTIVSKLNCTGFSCYMGPVGPDELRKVRAGSDVLVHVESFNKSDIYITRLSISTKIPEYLASGRCIYAIGPRNVASIKYIVENNLGFCTDSFQRGKMKEDLMDVVLSPERRRFYAERGLLYAKERHNPIETAALVRRLVFAAGNNNA